MNNLICIPVNEMNCIKISESQLFIYIYKYACEYGFLWWHNDRNVFKYWLAHETIWNGKSSQKRTWVTVKDFDLKKDLVPCLDKLLSKRLCRN